MTNSQNSSKFKNLLLNLITFKFKAFNPSFKWLFIYPRNRLYAAMWIIFQEKKTQKDKKLLMDLVGCTKEEKILDRFFKLRERFG